MNGLWVMPKIAGIESSAKIRSVVPRAMKHDQHRGEDLLAVDRGAHLRAVELLGDRDALAQPPDQLVLHLLLFLVARERLGPGRVEQEESEDVEHPAEVRDELRRPG